MVEKNLFFKNIIDEEFYDGAQNEIVYSIVKYNKTYHIFSSILDNILNYSRNTGMEVFKHPNSIITYHNYFDLSPIEFIDTYKNKKIAGKFLLGSNNASDEEGSILWIEDKDTQLSYKYRNCRITSAILPNIIRENRLK